MTIRVVFTTSIISPDRNEIYKKSITDTIKQLQSYPVHFYIVENNGTRKTALDDISGCKLLYTSTNNVNAYAYRKGIKEIFDVLFVADHYNFEKDDIIIKITGRYTLKSALFLETVLANEANYDCFIKPYNVCTNEFVKNDCVLGLYGIRYSVLQDINPIRMVLLPSMEVVFMEEVRSLLDEDRVLEVRQLDLYLYGDDRQLV